MVPLLLVVLVGVWIGMGAAGAGVYYLMKSGKLAQGQMSGARSDGVTHSVVLEPILVNLADAGGQAYLRLGLTVDVAGEAPSGEKTESKGGEADSIRDTVLTVLGRQTSAYLLGADGKEHLKIELKEAIAKSSPAMKVSDVFFTEFLVQI